jgi:hypothetical protein
MQRRTKLLLGTYIIVVSAFLVRSPAIAEESGPPKGCDAGGLNSSCSLSPNGTTCPNGCEAYPASCSNHTTCCKWHDPAPNGNCSCGCYIPE